MLITRRISFLQSIQKAASNGYFYYTAGRVSVEKFPAFFKKINEAYQPNQPRHYNYRKKQKGEARVKFFCYPDEYDPSGLNIFFVIMVTGGTHIVHELEPLQDLRVRKSRLRFSDYVLVQKPGSLTHRFTFKLSEEAYSFYLAKLRQAVRSKSKSNIAQIVKKISNLSGFSGVRQQKKQLRKHYQGELKKSFGLTVSHEWPDILNLYARQFKVDCVKNVNLFCQKVVATQQSAIQLIAHYHKNQTRRNS